MGRRTIMEMIERLIITYLANALWMTCVVAAAAMLLAKLVRRGPAAYRHALWVMAIAFASLLPFAALRKASPVERDVTGTMGNTLSEAIPAADGTSSPNSFAFQKHLHQRTISFAPLLTDLLTGVYLVFVIYRVLSLGRAWYRTQVVLRGAANRALSPRQAETVARCCAALRLDRVSIALSQNFVSPCIVGVWRPRLICRNGSSQKLPMKNSSQP
jgi:beta-lactamase regulating signal transducer with metallopeptidase domain